MKAALFIFIKGTCTHLLTEAKTFNYVKHSLQTSNQSISEPVTCGGSDYSILFCYTQNPFTTYVHAPGAGCQDYITSPTHGKSHGEDYKAIIRAGFE